MRKINKNIFIALMLFTCLFIFVDTAQAELCREKGISSCNNTVDDNGDECMQYSTGTGGAKCVPKNCYAYNRINGGYEYTTAEASSDGKFHLNDCENDNRCFLYGNSCIPISKKQGFTCEDIGLSVDFGGNMTSCTTDWWGNQCISTDMDANGVWNCKTDPDEAQFYDDPDNFVCTDDWLQTETVCNEHEEDSLKNQCAWDGKKCIIVYDQMEINKTADNAKMNGQNDQDAVEAKKTEILSKIKKTCRLYPANSCPPQDQYGYECEKRGNICRRKNIIVTKNPFKCSDVKYLTGAWTLIRIAAPFIIILFGSLDFIKAVMASDEKKMKETKGKFIKRIIAFVLLILLPFVIQFIFSNMGTYGSDNMCLVKCIVTNNTSEEECE